MQQQQKNEKFGMDLRESMNATYAIAYIHTMCLLPFLRCNFGTNVPGIAGIAALILLLFMTASQDPAMTVFLFLWLLALACQRCRTWRLVSNGWREHSQYGGRPWLAMLIPFVRTEMAAKTIEPGLCFLVGGLLCGLSETLGLFVMAGIVSLTIVRGIQLESLRRQMTAYHDLQIEQQAMSERVRGVRNDF